MPGHNGPPLTTSSSGKVLTYIIYNTGDKVGIQVDKCLPCYECCISFTLEVVVIIFHFSLFVYNPDEKGSKTFDIWYKVSSGLDALIAWMHLNLILF